MLFEPGPLAPLDPALFEAFGSERPMSTIVAEAGGTLIGADRVFDDALRLLGDAADDVDDATADRNVDDAAAQLHSELELVAPIDLGDLHAGAAEFENELAGLGATLPPEGGLPNYGTLGDPTDRFEDRPETPPKEGPAPVPTSAPVDI